MRTIKGPGIFLAQFIAPVAPYDKIETLAPWAAEKGYKGVQVPTFNPAVFDLEQAAASRTWCDEYKGLLAEHGGRARQRQHHADLEAVGGRRGGGQPEGRGGGERRYAKRVHGSHSHPDAAARLHGPGPPVFPDRRGTTAPGRGRL